MKKQVLLIAFLLILAFNFSNLLFSVTAEEAQVSEGQQLRLTPIGEGSNTKLLAVEGISGPYFPENWQYAQYQDSKYLRADYQHESDTDTYQLSNHDPTKQFGSIYGIELVIRYLKSGWGQGIEGAIYINDTLYNTEEKVTDAGSDDGIYKAEIVYNPATGEPWTWDDIDNLEAGVTSYIGSLGSHADIDQVYVTVNYGLDATILTNPPDCNVTLDEVTLDSGSDGATFTGLAPYSTFNVTVSKQYYYSATETIYINDTNIQMTISLAPSQYRLTVTTNPENCKVLIDGVEQTSGWFPENTQHKISVSKDFFYNSKEETVTVGNHDTTMQVTLSLSPIPFIAFGLIGLVTVILIYVAFKNRKRIAGWNEARVARIAQEDPAKRRERQRNILMTLIIAMGAILVLVLFFLGGAIGLGVAILNLAGIIFWLYYDNFSKMDYIKFGAVAILFLGVVAVLYALAGSFWGPIAIVVIDGVIFVVFFGSPASDKSTSRGGGGGGEGVGGTRNQYTSSYQSGKSIGGGYGGGRAHDTQVVAKIGNQKQLDEEERAYLRRKGELRAEREEGNVADTGDEDDHDDTYEDYDDTDEDAVYKKKRSPSQASKGKTYEELVGDNLSNLSYEKMVGKRKKKRYF